MQPNVPWASSMPAVTQLTPLKWLLRCLKTKRLQIPATGVIWQSMGSWSVTRQWWITLEEVVQSGLLVVSIPSSSGPTTPEADPNLEIRNPIHLARVILEHSTKPLSLRRVPPNLLVGQGAIDFAFESGVPVLPKDALISAGAHERWLRWKSDLQKLSETRDDESQPPADIFENKQEGHERQRQHEAQTRLLAACWNESQPYSPALTPSGSSDPVDMFGASAQTELRTLSPRPTSDKSEFASGSPPADSKKPEKSPGTKHVSWPHRKQNNDGQGYTSYGDDDNNDDEESSLIDNNPELTNSTKCYAIHQQATCHTDLDLLELSAEGSLSAPDSRRNLAATRLKPPPENPRTDEITDTVGAIAIDCLGNIAAGSSSGGIGMKHRGRVGPAALVGVGTAVVPIDPDDPLKTSCATVTSGTGEHMATTMAAMTCASRIYNCERRGKDGALEDTDCNGAMNSFVQKDFMGRSSNQIRAQFITDMRGSIGHPSVVNSHSAGAIGVLALKKTKDGVWLYWSHNTDSFVRPLPLNIETTSTNPSNRL